MKRSATFIPHYTDTNNTEIESFQMLLRGGFIKQVSDDIYCILPLGKRLISKLEKEIISELEKIEAMEISLPTLQINPISKEQNPFSLSSNHYVTMVSLIENEIDSNLPLPLIFFQIDKFSDHTKQYILNEVYSFHDDEESFQQTYDQLLNVYKNLLVKLGLPYRIVKGVPILESGEEEELFILSETGDETIVYSDQSNYSANIKIAQVGYLDEPLQVEMKPLEKFQLNIQTIQDVAETQSISIKDCIKNALYHIDGTYYLVLTRADFNISETKLQHVLKAKYVRLADEKEIENILNCTKGYVGPIKLPLEVKVIADITVKNMKNAIAGSNENGFFYKNVNANRDFAVNLFEDIRVATEGDLSPDKEGTLHLEKGFKVAHIGKLNLTKQLKRPLYVNCFYFGITQLFTILAEKYHDSNGFIWPKEVAPFQIYLVVKNVQDEVQKSLADEIYNILTFYRFEVLYDDRNESSEQKLLDSDLIGLPIRVTVGEMAQVGVIDVQIRNNGQTLQFAKEELFDWLTEYFRVE